MPDLAVIIICKNQAWNINRLIESVLEETNDLSSETILVDSASTDDTLTIASKHSISIVQLTPNQRLTAAAGRYVGCQYTTAEKVLFLDGDMELIAGWLERACTVMDSNPEVAAITGQVIDLPKDADAHIPAVAEDNGSEEIHEIPYTGGAAMYRRTILNEVGHFNPYLYSDEEPDVCIRIRHRGYRVLDIGHPLAYHYSDPAKTLGTVFARWRRNLYLGAGQNLRYHLGSEVFWPYIRERGYGLIPGLGLIIGLISFLLSATLNQWQWFGLWLGLVGIIFLADALRKRSVYGSIASFFERLMILDGTLRGFAHFPHAPETYPAKVTIVKRPPEFSKTLTRPTVGKVGINP